MSEIAYINCFNQCKVNSLIYYKVSVSVGDGVGLGINQSLKDTFY